MSAHQRSVSLTERQKADAVILQAQGETPERIAAHFGVEVDALKPRRRRES